MAFANLGDSVEPTMIKDSVEMVGFRRTNVDGMTGAARLTGAAKSTATARSTAVSGLAAVAESAAVAGLMRAANLAGAAKLAGWGGVGQRRRWRGEVVGWECWSGWAPWVRSLVHTRIWSSYKPGTDPPPEAILRVPCTHPFPLDPNPVLWITERLWITSSLNQPADTPTRRPVDIPLSTAVEKVIHKALSSSSPVRRSDRQGRAHADLAAETT
ncbi:hypothetical protein Aple_073300 [Acrocarpospora pleiomorpha]|uniref:Uncharacterized protein n=1 Tax=Acrocarpospora pleiomorpha TaxID=90975 RepID=A0A5M3XXZ7_9ACTN|nr:hypothetical protein Aple_073300 [Acrocarpospora pleiomorpha]